MILGFKLTSCCNSVQSAFFPVLRAGIMSSGLLWFMLILKFVWSVPFSVCSGIFHVQIPSLANIFSDLLHSDSAYISYNNFNSGNVHTKAYFYCWPI
jgi:hypothetical protein